MKLKTAVLFTTLFVAVTLQAQDDVEMITIPAVPVAGEAISGGGVDPAPVAEAEPSPAAGIEQEPVMGVEPVATVDDAIETIALQEDSGDRGTMKSGLISVSLKEVELSNVIRLFATLSNANIIVPTLEGDAGLMKVDVNLNEVEWKPALQSILETQGLELYEKNPGTAVYSVRKKPVGMPDPLTVKTFKLNYATVAGVSEMITTMIPAPGKISVFPARNTIVVQSTPENLAEIQDMIAAVDLPRQQVFIEAKFLELTDRASEQLGIDWQVLGGTDGGYGVSAGPFAGEYGRTRTDVETTPAFGTAGPILPETYTTAAGSTVPIAVSDSFKQTFKSATTTALLDAEKFSLVLGALKEINGTKIVSNPKIIVANEETAQIYIGTKEPNIKQTTTQVENTAPITTYNLDPDMPYFEYGIKLDVTPTVNTEDNITVAIKPSLKRFLRDKLAGGNSYPVTSEKTIDTFFSLENGQTAAIGGLTELNANDVNRKVPLLGSIPLIGRLFSYTSKVNEQTETIIFVTVGLANPGNINMETGLPQESVLAMRQAATMKANREIKAEELRIFNQMELERTQTIIKELQAVEQKRLQKQAEKDDSADAEADQ